MSGILIHYARILGTAVLLLLVVITVLFLLLEIAPGDPVTSLIGEVPVTQEYRDLIIQTFGLDRPVWERYFVYLGNILSGNLGYSVATQAPIADLIGARALNTLAIALPAFLISTVLGSALGTIAARTRRRWLDGILSGGAVAIFSIPNFWLGLMLIVTFAITLRWLPAQGMSPYGSSGIQPEYLILPIITMAMTELAFKLRVARASVIEALGQDYIDTARSKGLSRRRVLWRHALPNALLPMVTVSGVSLGYMIAGSALVEKVFNWPGMGLLLVDALGRKENQIVLGVVIVITISVLVVNILTDIVYGLVDPRLRQRALTGRRTS